MVSYGTVDRDYGMRLATRPPADDGPIYMLNLMKYRERADYGADGDGDASGREADDRYAPLDVLAAIGAVVCFTADVEAASESWDRIGVVRYPTRRAFIEMQSRPDFKAKHVHKEAGMDHTTVMGTLPAGPLPSAARPTRLLLEIWDGDEPAPVAHGSSARFEVEGTIVGDGRRWTGARYTELAGGAAIDVSRGSPSHQLLVVRPTIERWR